MTIEGWVRFFHGKIAGKLRELSMEMGELMEKIWRNLRKNHRRKKTIAMEVYS
jgi:hypothetical protein